MTDGPTGATSLATQFHDLAASRPEAPALLRADGSVAWTVGTLAAVAARRAARLADRGIGPGDAVLVLARPDEAVAVAAAVIWCGAALLVPPRGIGPRAALRVALATRPRAVVASPGLWALALLQPRLLGVPVRFVAGTRGVPGIAAIDSGDHAFEAPFLAADGDPAAITFTTGTTGHPRPIVRTHGVLRGQHEAIERLRPAQPGDVDLVGLPMLVLHDLVRGVPAVLPPPVTGTGERSGKALAAAISWLRVTTAVGFPPLFEDLARFAPRTGYPDLRAIHVGGAPVPVELVRRLGVAAPNATVTVVYGATEAEPIAAIDGDDYVTAMAARRPGDGICVGRPVPGLETRLSGPMAAGGLLEVRGPQVAVEVGGTDAWRALGDLARVDPDGRIWLLGRARSAVDDVPPLVIEEAAESIAGVRAAALVVLPGRMKPILALGVAAADEGRAVALVRELAAARGWVLDVTAVRAIPRERSSGKIDPRALERRLGRSRTA